MASWVRSWWGTKEAPSAAPSQLDTMEKIEGTLNMLVVQQMQYEHELQQLQAELDANKAHWLASGQKNMLATKLRRKRELQQIVAQKAGQIANLEKMQQTGQHAASAVEIAQTMQQGNAMVQQLTTEVKVEEVEDIFDDFSDRVHDVDEISRATSAPIVGHLDPEADEEIAAEIAAMQLAAQAERDVALPEAPEAPVRTQPRAPVQTTEAKHSVMNE